ncbi:hypothetical protein Sj15T_12490 [Sphingobium sp. TA15]|uniref:DUF1330 domain-containing protein n=1 Tax=Sphingobium indicum (strain DSM 16413 / CCM 7287 / MTCC 6362 / UT26 / NBRC 101211 / UT26S) TaxID=452662 RepID=D4Z2F9_SPHIU|nr:DUF1330 domain-containing protein [Sphingobium indicum]BAI96791.1 hypothetical protein SJA_C1-19570 [Sphingobium indicum UT26S]BDD66228.1 hypothetical protein Sj15T_12490 [Sphingobium sp. TA15]
MEQFIDPLPAAFAFFKSLPRDTPIHMLNLARYKDMAEYPADHPQVDAQWSGRRAYAEYGRLSEPILRRVGGNIVWRGAFEALVIGEPGQIWDDAFIAHYPSTEIFFELIKDPDFPAAWVHRSAGILDYRLMRFAPREPGHGFGSV